MKNGLSVTGTLNRFQPMALQDMDVSGGNLVGNNDEMRYWPTLRQFPLPAKVLVTATMLTMAVGMLGALGQIVIHDIIPKFASAELNPVVSKPSQSPLRAMSGETYFRTCRKAPLKIFKNHSTKANNLFGR